MYKLEDGIERLEEDLQDIFGVLVIEAGIFFNFRDFKFGGFIKGVILSFFVFFIASDVHDKGIVEDFISGGQDDSHILSASGASDGAFVQSFIFQLSAVFFKILRSQLGEHGSLGKRLHAKSGIAVGVVS